MAKPDNELRDTQIIRDLAKGTRQTKIADKHNISHARVSQIKAANRELVEKEKEKLISLLPTARQTVELSLSPATSKSVWDNADKGDKDRAYRASKDLMQAIGIMPSPTNITLSVGGDLTLAPVVAGILELHDKSGSYCEPDEEITDVEWEESE